jgi:hypothetical protein
MVFVPVLTLLLRFFEFRVLVPDKKAKKDNTTQGEEEEYSPQSQSLFPSQDDPAELQQPGKHTPKHIS